MKRVSIFASYNSSETLPKYFEGFRVVIDDRELGFVISDDFLNKLKKQNPGYDLKELFTIYDKWLAIFPFDLPVFKEFYKHYKDSLPLKYNPKKGSVSFCTPIELMEILTKISNAYITQIDASKLFKARIINDIDEHNLNLILKGREIKTQNFNLSEVTDYSIMVEKWLKEEKDTWKELKPYFNVTPPAPPTEPTKTEILSDIITHENSIQIVEKVKIQYKNIKGKRLKLLLIALQDLELLPKERIASKFYELCKKEFDWNIASYNAMNGQKYNERTDKEELTSMKEFIKSIINDK